MQYILPEKRSNAYPLWNTPPRTTILVGTKRERFVSVYPSIKRRENNTRQTDRPVDVI